MKHSIVAAASLSVLAIALIGSCSKKTTAPKENPAVCLVTPATLDFSNLPAGESATRQFTIQNTGGGVLAGSVGQGCDGFTVVESPAYSLHAGESATFHVSCIWRQAGPAECTVPTGTNGCAGVHCTVNGGVSPCGVSPTTLSFGHVSAGSRADRQFTVTNTGTTSFIATARETCADFSLVGDANFIIQPGQTAQYTVRFAPTHGGDQSCTISLSNVCSLVLCSGTGDATGCFVSPTTLDFGTVQFGDFADQSFIIRNDGTGQLVGQVGNYPDDNICGSFVLQTDPHYSLAPGQQKTFTVRMVPRLLAEGGTACEVESGSDECALVRYQAVVLAPETGFCPRVGMLPVTTLDFGDVPMGQTVTRTIHVEGNSTDCDWSAAKMGLNILGPDFSFADGTRSKEFELDPPVNGDLVVAFRPTAEGEESLVITSYRICGPPGTAGAPCKSLIGRGVGVRVGASSGSWRKPAVWRPRARY